MLYMHAGVTIHSVLYKLSSLSFFILHLCISFSLHQNYLKEKTMVARNRRDELNNFVRSMYEEGTLDQNFDLVRELQNDDSPTFVTDMITMFLQESDSVIPQIRNFMEPPIDYENLRDAAHHLKGASLVVGGCRVVQACLELISAVDDRDKHRQVVPRVMDEYHTLREKLNHMADLEREVRAFQRRQGRRR